MTRLAIGRGLPGIESLRCVASGFLVFTLRGWCKKDTPVDESRGARYDYRVTTSDTLITLGISLGLGLLVGLQRERKGEELAGIRTFALLTLLGTIAGLVAGDFGSSGVWIIAAGAIGVAILMAVGAFIKARHNAGEIGLTTEIAALVMYGIGAYLVDRDHWLIALVLGGGVVLLLYWKELLHGFVRHMGDKDVSAIMTFVLVALVIWPILPNQKLGWYGFFNPFETWLVVVLVVGMSLVGYVLYKLVPPTAGAMLGGAVGGLISSTATTVSYSRRAREDPASTVLAAQAIMMANTVSVLRVMILLAIFAGEKAGAMELPLGTMAGVMAVLCFLTWWMGRKEHTELPEQGNPTELRSALLFAAIYTLVKLATAWGKDAFGNNALFVVGGISGLTDVDAITLSMGQSSSNQSVAVDIAWRVIMVAVMANLIFKAGTVYVLGNRRLRGWITLLFAATFAAGVVILWLWR